MKTPHKHAELIKAWTDGAEIEVGDAFGWQETTLPLWHEYFDYRIKPEPKPDPKPDVVRYGFAPHYWGGKAPAASDNIKVTFDGETGKLKSAEVIS